MTTALNSETNPAPCSCLDADILVLDAHTQKDLEIFGSDTGGSSLFQFCNLTNTSGSANALRRRMELPWSSASRIRATQESLSFITAHRQVFTMLPEYLAQRARQYLHDILPIVPMQNMLEFGVRAFSLRANESSHYFRIALGVQGACGLIRSLRRFLQHAELASPVGELASLFEEINELLARPRLAGLPEKRVGNWVWKILRLDQIFRIHETKEMDRLVQLVCEIGALIAMADVTRKHGFVLPSIAQGPLHVHAEGLVHPFVQHAVANPVELDQENRVLFLTGPNMAGKTTYIRAFATALYFAQLGMGVPARSFRFVPTQRLFSSISLSDDLRNGISYFHAEALRVKAVSLAVAEGYRVVALMDEPFKGTNVQDALEASLAIIGRFAAAQDCLFMFSSHLIELREELNAINEVDCSHFAAHEGEGRLRFDYLLRPGVSSQRLGMRVLHEEGVFELLDKYLMQS